MLTHMKSRSNLCTVPAFCSDKFGYIANWFQLTPKLPYVRMTSPCENQQKTIARVMSTAGARNIMTYECDLNMSIETARAHFRRFGIENRVLEFEESSATLELASRALCVSSARISKTLSFKTEKGCMLVICAGDARIDNHKFRDHFYIKAKMLLPEEVDEMVGHAVGGVCPFGIKDGIPVYLDESMLRFDTVFPAAGSSNSAIELTIDELFKYSRAKGWVDICTVPAATAVV